MPTTRCLLPLSLGLSLLELSSGSLPRRYAALYTSTRSRLRPRALHSPGKLVRMKKEGEEGVVCHPESSICRRVKTELCFGARKIRELETESWYSPPVWMRNPHVHTIVAALARKTPAIRFRRDILDTADGGKIAVDVMLGLNDTSTNPKVPRDEDKWLVLTSGLSGGSQDSYVQSMCKSAYEKGWNVVVLNMRGCGQSPVTSPRFFSAMRGSIDDLKLTVRHVREKLAQKTSNPTVASIGWSMGGSIVGNYLAFQDSPDFHLSERIQAGAALAAPFDMILADKSLNRNSFNRLVYDRNLARKLVTMINQHVPLLERHGGVLGMSGEVVDVDLEALSRAESVREIDELLTRRSFGYPTVDAYYKDVSLRHRLHKVASPLLVVSALDDPIADANGIPLDVFRENKKLLLVATRHGGHLGWCDSNSADAAQQRWCAGWVENVSLKYLDAVLEDAHHSCTH
ncbi:hypothetical protein AAMO2058_001489900 [Amorphochlora amoebiformis]